LAVDEKAFQRYSHYYDLLYRDKDYAAEVDYVARTLSSVAPNVRRLLEFGSGTGRHGRLLAALGFDVVGIECSETMVAEARRDAPTCSQLAGNFDCRHGDIRTVNLQSGL
jgi:cyclopropane fatty-acyl-phospholipid synthase-like methyltransferase